MAESRVSAIIIEPDGTPLPTRIDNDLLALNKAVNINWRGEPHKEFHVFDIIEIKDNIHIISSPKGEERSLPITRTIGKDHKFYGLVYIVKLKGSELKSMSNKEIVEYCQKFFHKNLSLEDFGISSTDYDEDDYDDSPKGRLEITFDEW